MPCVSSPPPGWFRSLLLLLPLLLNLLRPLLLLLLRPREIRSQGRAVAAVLAGFLALAVNLLPALAQGLGTDLGRVQLTLATFSSKASLSSWLIILGSALMAATWKLTLKSRRFRMALNGISKASGLAPVFLVKSSGVPAFRDSRT